jgi:hypothetical protein
MALFAGQPAGVQIKKWLIILVSLIVVINVLAAGSLVRLQRYVIEIQAKYQPVMTGAGEISTQVCRAQVDLYKYLGEYQASTAEVESRIHFLEETLEEVLRHEGSREWREELETIRDSLVKYRVVVRNLPAIGAETDWNEVDEFRSQAVMLGQEMEAQASALKGEVSARIEVKAAQAQRFARVAVVVCLGFLALSTLITVLLFAWWNQFQDMILNL